MRRVTGTKALEDEIQTSVRERVERIIARDFDGVASQAAKALSVSQSQMVEFRKGTRGLGLNNLVRVAEYEGISLDELVGRTGARTRRAESPADIPTALASVLRTASCSEATLEAVRGRVRAGGVDHWDEEIWRDLVEGYERENARARRMSEVRAAAPAILQTLLPPSSSPKRATAADRESQQRGWHATTGQLKDGKKGSAGSSMPKAVRPKRPR
jgi:hypothetical protein